MATAFTSAIMMVIHTITQTPVVVRQASLGRGPGIRKGCPYISGRQIKLDRVVGTDVSRTPPIYRPSSVDSMLASFTRHCALLASAQRSYTPQEAKP